MSDTTQPRPGSPAEDLAHIPDSWRPRVPDVPRADFRPRVPARDSSWRVVLLAFGGTAVLLGVLWWAMRAQMPEWMSLHAAGMLFIAAVLVGFALYLLPTIIALKRGHRNTVGIAVVNVVFGWLLLGWVVAFIWSIWVERPQKS